MENRRSYKPARKKVITLESVDDHLKEKLKNPVFKKAYNKHRKKQQLSLYFVTTLRRDGKFPPKNDNRCIGYYPKIEQARWLVIHNFDILSENGWYQWAVIERFGPGWYNTDYFGQEEWYKFHKKGARKILKPKRFARVINFGIG